ncbi:MAG TPA: hypothetical protein VLM85_08470 [Polyangiaceae bacterium]|nr:hypothetical protein [Polyangiaceae bacterium]
MRLSSSLVLVGSLLVASGCNLLKHKEEADSGAPSTTTTGATTSEKSGSSGSSEKTTKLEATEGNDPSKGATSGCGWPTDDVTKDLTFTKGCIVTAKRSFNVDEGATVTFEEGVKVSFETDTYIWVNYGKLVVKGTDAAPVVFTSANKSPASGDWVGLGFREKTMAGTSLDHLIIEYAGSKAQNGVGAIQIDSMRQGGRISITNTTIRNSAQFGLVADENATFAKFENDTFKDNKNGSLSVVAQVLGSVGKGNTFGNPIHVKNSDVDQTTTWPPFDVPVVVDGHIKIQSDSSVPTLTIADKTVVKMGQDGYIDVQAGALVAKNVSFTSAAPSPGAGDWVGFFIRKKSNGTHIENCTFEYFGSTGENGRGAITFWSVDAKDLTGVTIANNTFKNGKQAAMSSEDHDCTPFKNNKADGVPLCAPKN